MWSLNPLSFKNVGSPHEVWIYSLSVSKFACNHSLLRSESSLSKCFYLNFRLFRLTMAGLIVKISIFVIFIGSGVVRWPWFLDWFNWSVLRVSCDEHLLFKFTSQLCKIVHRDSVRYWFVWISTNGLAGYFLLSFHSCSHNHGFLMRNEEWKLKLTKLISSFLTKSTTSLSLFSFIVILVSSRLRVLRQRSSW